MLTLLVCPEARPVIVQVTVWLAMVQVPDAATAESTVSPAGTASVNVIGPVSGPALLTVADRAARLPTAGALGAALVITPASTVVVRVTDRSNVYVGPRGPPLCDAVSPTVGVAAGIRPTSISAADVEPPEK